MGVLQWHIMIMVQPLAVMAMSSEFPYHTFWIWWDVYMHFCLVVVGWQEQIRYSIVRNLHCDYGWKGVNAGHNLIPSYIAGNGRNLQNNEDDICSTLLEMITTRMCLTNTIQDLNMKILLSSDNDLVPLLDGQPGWVLGGLLVGRDGMRVNESKQAERKLLMMVITVLSKFWMATWLMVLLRKKGQLLIETLLSVWCW